MMKPYRVAVAASMLLACTKSNPGASCANGTCSDPNYPYCDQDGVIAGAPNACIAVTCTPGQFGACDGDALLVCNANGNGYVESTCASGCNATSKACNVCTPNTARCVGSASLESCDANGSIAATETCSIACADAPSPHCRYLQPRYLPDVCDTVATGVLDITTPASFDVDLDANCTGGVVPQAGGPSICVVRYGSIKIEAGAVVSVVSGLNQQGGSSGRAIAFVADSELTVAGELDVSASFNTNNVACNGAGGGTATSGGASSSLSGGGGAGFKTAGGAGGNPSSDGGAANGGGATSDPALLTAFIGGPAAGGTGSGGGGGGAVMLVACRGQVTISGTIGANGGGGLFGLSASGNTSHAGGWGGGAGGYVVIQGVGVTVTGSLFANGGGGASGAPGPIGTGASGENGSNRDTTPAAGAGSVSGNGAGGNGGFKTVAPGNGGKPTTSGAAGGGGGGSVGFLQVYAPLNVTPAISPAHASPPFQPNAVVQTR